VVAVNLSLNEEDGSLPQGKKRKEKKRIQFIRFHGKIIIFMYAEQLKLKKQYFSSLQDMRL
jgi:hypothetical protein